MKYFLLSFTILLFSCGAGVGDTSENLGAGYTYMTDGGWYRITSNYVFKKGIYGKVTDYAFDDNFIIAIQKTSYTYVKLGLLGDLNSQYGSLLYDRENIKITKHVKEFLNSDLWRDSILHKEIAYEILPGNYTKTENGLDTIAGKIIMNNKYFKDMFSRNENFYIIDKRQEKVYGPFSATQYLAKRKKLAVPEELQLSK